MTDRSRGFDAKSVGFAFAAVALTVFGVSGQALAASPQSVVTSRADVETAKGIFVASVKSSGASSRVDADPIDMSVRHRWPDLSVTGPSGLTHHAKS